MVYICGNKLQIMNSKYRFIERKGWGVIQKYSKNNWFIKLITGKSYSWKDFGKGNDINKEREFFDKYYKNV